MSTTKITSTSIRIALSYMFNTFEVTTNIENENGITTEEIDSTRKATQQLAQKSVDEYKLSPNTDLKGELKKIDQKVKDIAKMVKRPEVIDPIEVENIQNLPAYIPKK